MGILKNIKDVKSDIDSYIENEIESLENLLLNVESELEEDEPDLDVIKSKVQEALKLL